MDIGFERANLFEALRERYRCNEVLYPGSSVHITPSLFFPHVVYVDQSATAVEFFANMEDIQSYISKNKRYKRSAYIRFLAEDYTAPLTLPKGNFDLLISLYAGGISRACKKYLKVGGILVTNNHQDDIEDVVNDSGFRLKSVMKNRGGKYEFIDEAVGDFVVATAKRAKTKNYLRSTSQGFAYREDTDTYFIFERRKRP